MFHIILVLKELIVQMEEGVRKTQDYQTLCWMKHSTDSEPGCKGPDKLILKTELPSLVRSSLAPILFLENPAHLPILANE